MIERLKAVNKFKKKLKSYTSKKIKETYTS